MRKWLRRFKYFFRQRRIEAELREEMDFHRLATQERLEHSGLTDGQAAAAARRALGNVSLAREDARQVWIRPKAESIWQDFKYDDRPETPVVGIISFSSWKTQFNGDESIAGRMVTVDDVPVTVIGVAGNDFVGTVDTRTDIWLPLSAALVFRPNDRWVREELSASARAPRVFGYFALTGRLRPGVPPAQAAAELDVLTATFDRTPRQGGRGVRLSDTSRGARGFNGAAFSQMFGAVIAVLVLACANVGNMLIARAGARRREIAVRLSLGASRVRIIRQLLTESLALALLAGIGGIVLALYVPRFAIEAASGQPSALQLGTDRIVLAYTFGVCVVSCLLFGLAPALHATRGSVSTALKSDAAIPGIRFSLRSLLLSVQVAVSVVLLVAAALLVRGVQRAHALDHGFRIDGITVLSFQPPATAYDAARTRVFSARLSDRLAALSDDRIALAHVAPFGDGNIKGSHRMPGNDTDEFNTVYEVSPSYFSVLGLPIVAGRIFAPGEQNAILVNETLARRFGSPRAAVGRTITSSPDPGWNLPGELQIVGVVRDAYRTPIEPVYPLIYQPISGRTVPQIILRDAAEEIARMTAIGTALEPRMRVRTFALSQNIDRRLDHSTSAATIATALGSLALTLAAVGMFGAFAFWVQQRTKEIGIRMALGAREVQVVQLVLTSSGRAIVIGLVLGLAAGIATGRLLRSSLYGLSALDPLAYAAVGLLLIVTSLAATFIPARRAARVDPLIALRTD